MLDSMIGTLYVMFPDHLRRMVAQELARLYPGSSYVSHEADGYCIFGVQVPCPEGEVRSGLAKLYQVTNAQTSWAWQAPEGALVWPGGCLHVNVPFPHCVAAFIRLCEVFPTEQIYTFDRQDETLSYLIDVVAPAPDLEQKLHTLVASAPGASWIWQPWTDEKEG